MDMLASERLVPPNQIGRRRRRSHCHVLLIEFLDRVPIEVELLGNILDRRLAAPPLNKVGEPLRVEWVVGQKFKPLAYHFAAGPAKYAPHFEFEIYPRIAARKIAHAANRAVVPTAMQASTTTTSRFLERRLSLMMRALTSPKMPRTVPSGRKPGNEYASHSRRFRFAVSAIRNSAKFRAPSERSKSLQ